MSNEVTSEQLAAACAPKSDQLNADDLMFAPMAVKIVKVKPGNKEQPIVIELADGLRPYKPCKSMIRILRAHFGDNAQDWINQQLILFRDPDAEYGGVKMGGIRISHATGLTAPKTFVITTRRGRRSEYTLLPFPTVAPADKAYIDDVLAEIAAAESLEALNAIGLILKTKSKPIQDAVRGAYAARKKELSTEVAANGQAE